MCLSPKTPAVVQQQEAKAPDRSNLYRAKKSAASGMQGGTVLTGASGAPVTGSLTSKPSVLGS